MRGVSSFQQLLQGQKQNETFLCFYKYDEKSAQISYGDFLCCTLNLARTLFWEHNVRQGSHVALAVGNSLEAYVGYAAVLYLGAVLIPLNPQDPEGYWRDIVTHAEADLIVATEELSISFKKISRPTFFLKAENFFGNADDRQLPVITTNPALMSAALFYTSGTTGTPKGVLLSWGSLLANIRGTCQTMQLTERNVLMSCLPLYHVNAFNFAFLLPIFLGCKIIYQSPFFQMAFWKIVRTEKVEILSLVPSVLSVLVQEKREIDIGALRFVISAAAPLHRDLLTKFIEKFKIRVLQGYGLSEAVNFSLLTPPGLSEEEYADAAFSEPLPSAGTPVEGNEIFLLDEEQQFINEPGRTGELLIGGENVFSGYFKNPQAAANTFYNGLLRTGDIGYYREIGGRNFYFLQGRNKEIIKRNGEIIYLSEIDAVLRQHGFMEAFAVGFRNIHTGEEVGLYILENEKERADQALSKVREKLGFHRAPKVAICGTTLPQTSVGKLKRKALEPLFSIYHKSRFLEKDGSL